MTQRLTIDQAASRLGVSRPTVRRRLRSGQLRGEQVPTAQGFVWQVLIDSPGDSSAGESPGSQAPPQPSLQDEAARLRDEHISDLRRRVDDQAREIAELHRLLAQAHQHGHLLTDSASGESPGSRNGRAQPQQSAPSPEWEARRWWQRLLWG